MPTSSLAFLDFSRSTANSKATFIFPKVRISVLTARCIRVETSNSGRFEDRPTQQFLFRNQPLPQMNIKNSGDSITIETDFFELHYQDTGKSLTQDSLEVKVKETGAFYHYGEKNPSNLPGTARTLDETSGTVKLSPGLISRSGWSLIDDSSSLVFTPSGWLEPRPAERSYQDLYLLVCGQDYKAALADYQNLAGSVPLIPRYMLGNWWSRFWEYSEKEIRTLVGRFQKEEIPLSVFIIDMDWHITQTGNDCIGWTGFSWNRKLFPDPEGLLHWLHSQNLVVSLNLHPAEGVHAHEDHYAEMAVRMDLDPTSREPVEFDITDTKFTEAYFETLLHPLEAQGVDFWWIDWQQGFLTRVPNLDPLWWLNHLHYTDLGRDTKKRPVIFSRWGGPGAHRYPIGFSGDTIISWQSLAFQPYFTATAANAAYGWWSHDIGGHMRGTEDVELYTRWVQFGLLSPIFRLHATKDKFIDHQPWAFGLDVLQNVREVMQLRNALVPYLYSMAHRNTQTGLPLCTPLYYDWPTEEAAYLTPNEYLFGDQLLAAPVTDPADASVGHARQVVWFPAGEWVDFFTDERYQGPGWRILYTPLEHIPLFARAGAILPLRPALSREDGMNPKKLDLQFFPGSEGHFSLYEDDNTSQNYLHGEFCITEIEQHSYEIEQHSYKNTLEIIIQLSKGELSLLPECREYRLLLQGVSDHPNIHLQIDGVELPVIHTYDTQKHELSIGPFSLRPEQSAKITIESQSLLAEPQSLKEKVIEMLKIMHCESVTKWRISTIIDELKQDIHKLESYDLVLTDAQKIALIETITGVGAAEMQLPDGKNFLIAINPNQMAGFTLQQAPGKPIQINSQFVKEVTKNKTAELLVNYFNLVKRKF